MKPRSTEFTFSKTDAALVTQLYQKQFKSKDNIDTTELKLSNPNLLKLAKNSMVGIDAFNKASEIENNKERFENFVKHAELFSNTADHLGTIARLAGSRDLGKIAFSMKSMAQIGGALPGLVAGIKAGSLIGMVNPVCAIVAGVFALGSMFGGDDNDNNNAYQEAMIQYLQCIREEMHEGFSMVNKNIGIVYNTLRQSIIHLDKLIHQHTEYLDNSITLATNRLENTVFDRADVILRGLQDIHLADLEKIITDIGLMLNDQKKYDLKEKQKMIDSLYHWLVKGIRQPLQNGLNEFKSLQSNQMDVYKKINALITEPTDYARNIAFLAGISKLFSTNNKICNIDLNELINPGHWIYLLNIYCTARSYLTDNFDENQYQIKEILKAGQPYLEMTDAIRQKDFFKDMLKASEAIYKDIQKIFDASVEEVNKKINADLKKSYPNETEIKVDLSNKYEDIVNLFKSKIPQPIKPTCINISADNGYSFYPVSTDATYYKELVKYVTPEMIFLMKHGLASIDSNILIAESSRSAQNLYYMLNNKQTIIAKTGFDRSWEARWDIRTQKTENFDSDQQKSEEKALEIVKGHRESIAKIFLKSAEQTLSKLDAMRTLLKAYGYTAGLQKDEMKLVDSLESSKDIIDLVTDFAESKDASIALARLNWLDDLKKTGESLLAKIDSPDYFDNQHYNNILFLMELTKKLPELNQQIATIQDFDKQNDQASKLDQLTDSFVNLIESWNVYYPKEWLKQFEKSIPTSLYEKYTKQYDQLEAAYNNLQSELKNENPTLQAIYSSLRVLQKLAHQHHLDLKLISQKYAKSDNKYLITNDETGLLSHEEFNAIVKPQDNIKLIKNELKEKKEEKDVKALSVNRSLTNSNHQSKFEDDLKAAMDLSLKDKQFSLKMIADLKTQASKYGFKTEDVKRDGFCLLYAIEHQIFNNKELKLYDTQKQSYSYQSLHKKFVDHLLQYKIYYKNVTDNYDAFLKDALNYKTQWASTVGDVATIALSRALNMTIVSIPSDGGTPIILRRSNPLCVIYLGHEVGHHYQSLLKDESITKPLVIISDYINNAHIDTFEEGETNKIKNVSSEKVSTSIVGLFSSNNSNGINISTSSIPSTTSLSSNTR